MKLKYNFDGYDYEYETGNNVLDVLFGLFKEEYGLNHTQAKYIVDDFEMWDLLEEVIGEKYMDALLEHYEDEAREEFEEDRDYDKDKEGYYGVSRRWD